MAFDVTAAKAAGYSDTEIADHLAQQNKFDAAAARQHGYSDSDIIGHLTTAAPAPPEHEATPLREALLAAKGAYPPAAGALAGGALGLLGGPAAPVTVPAGALLGSVALPIADAGATAYNMGAHALGGSQIGMPSAAVDKFLTDKLALPTAEGTGERMVQAAGGALGSAASQIPAATNLAATAVSPVAKGIAESLSAAPKTQILTAPASAATGQYVAEKTGSPTAGLLASLAVGAAPGVKLNPENPAATRQEIRAASQAAYKTAADAGVTVKPKSFQDFVQDLNTSIINDDKVGYDPDLHPKVNTVLTRLDEDAQTQSPVSLEQLDKLRRVAGSARQQAAVAGDKDQVRLLTKVVNNIDDFGTNLRPDQLATGDASVAIPALQDARDLWRRNAKMQTIEDILSTSDALNNPNYIRQQFARIIKNKNQFNQYSPEERDLIKKINRSGIVESAGDTFAPSLQKSSALKDIVYAGMGMAHPATLVLPAAALAAKYGARAARRANVNALSDTIAGTPPQSLTSRMSVAPDVQQSLPAVGARSYMSQIDDDKARRAAALSGMPQ